MKKSIIGSFIGLAIVVAADTLIRVIISLTTHHPLSLFHYEIYDGFIWAIVICASTFATSFAGGAFTVTYADKNKLVGLISFGILLTLIRYGQIHYVMETELLFPMVSLFLSLVALFLVWKFYLRKKGKPSHQQEPPETGGKKHHQPDTTPW
ncbi:hypothetical protein DYD21_07580 [Rhodohalobacter sp. SW132]|uniref:hypothetical protein n=1 Tax=Rhodohalobacter sp. SW132 TaxID=2293433 RepID=UPI000E264661|nr:hypothetical protein [Rhodohalobacter sp. SW132]REL37636.1 hypothetical protein DYD21_07580 [Rhodohalobacter sp. SW132]